tara:strand:+ start:66 stop:563 length:498 start_codon:yes stop_codon:yes gene_type:complete
MSKETYIIEAPSQANLYFFPHHPVKYKWEKNKNDKRVKKLVTGSGGSYENDRHALAAAKETYPDLKNFKGEIRFKMVVNGKSCGSYKYGNNKMKQRVKRLAAIYCKLTGLFPSSRIAVPKKLLPYALKFWGANYYNWHLIGFKKVEETNLFGETKTYMRKEETNV